MELGSTTTLEEFAALELLDYATPEITGDIRPAADAAGNSSVDVADANSHCYWGTDYLKGSVEVSS